MRAPTTFADCTTLRVGGAPRAWVLAETEAQLIDAVSDCDGRREPVLLVGGGSNLVVSDAGFPGTAVRVALRGTGETVRAGTVTLDAMAGETWDDVVAYAIGQGWSGIEALSGIPGLVGATPVQNVGAYGQEVSQVITAVRVLDRTSGRVVTLDAAECGFGYRTSAFKRTPGRWAVLSVTMHLRADRTGPVRYGELAGILGVGVGGAADIEEVRAAVLMLRRRKGMVLDDADPDTWSAGSFFTNPVVAADVAGAMPAECPRYPSADGVKLSAAWLIESAGISRGFALRPDAAARISTRHTLALTNRGSASAADVMDLAREVQRRVEDVYGLRLEIEPTVVGGDD